MSESQHELAELIEHFSPQASPTEAALDQATLFERLGEHSELLLVLLELFPPECQKRLNEIREALAANQAGELEQAAHRLVGMSSSLSAIPAARAARVLEELARRDELHLVPQALAKLETELAKLLPTLAALTARMRAHDSI